MSLLAAWKNGCRICADDEWRHKLLSRCNQRRAKQRRMRGLLASGAAFTV